MISKIRSKKQTVLPPRRSWRRSVHSYGWGGAGPLSRSSYLIEDGVRRHASTRSNISWPLSFRSLSWLSLVNYQTQGMSENGLITVVGEDETVGLRWQLLFLPGWHTFNDSHRLINTPSPTSSNEDLASCRTNMRSLASPTEAFRAQRMGKQVTMLVRMSNFSAHAHEFKQGTVNSG